MPEPPRAPWQCRTPEYDRGRVDRFKGQKDEKNRDLIGCKSRPARSRSPRRSTHF